MDESGEPVGFISDGDILKRLSPRSNSFTDPIVLINSTVNDDEGYDEKLAKVMQMRASEIGAASPICVSVHANLTDVCRVLSENHLKKVPVLEAGHIVGIINRSDITQYSMAAYLADHPERAVYCGEGPSGRTSAWKRPARSVKFKQPRRARATGLLAFGKPRGQLMGERPRCSEVRFGVVRASSIFDFDSSCFQVAARWQRGSVDQPASSSGCLVDISRRSAAKRRATSLVLSERETIYRLPLRSLGSTSNRSLVS